jgi:hypothetical protein
VRWKGEVGDWTSLKNHIGAQDGVKNGALVEATNVGNVIKGCVDGVEVISATDNAHTEGNPGMGFNFGVKSSNGDFGLTSYGFDQWREQESRAKEVAHDSSASGLPPPQSR